MNAALRFVARPILRASLSSLLLLAVMRCEILLAQGGVHEQTFSVSVAEVKAAVQAVSATSRGRLPTLEGFVQTGDEPADHYDKGYYECTFQVSPAPGGGTTVRATVKVTAWYNDSNPAHSGYRILISNGRLESDALDRLAEKLAPNTTSNATSSASMPLPQVASSNSPAPNAGPRFSARLGSPSATIGDSSKSLLSSTPAPHIAPDPGISLPAGMTAESMKALQAANEKKSIELSNYVKNLEEIQRNQSRPADLAAVKKSQTPVFAKPAENTQVLLNADAQDEFPVLGVDGPWVHVQISGLSRGWIRRAQLEMPSEFSSAEQPHPSPEAHSANSAIFKVTKEETSAFTGTWDPLKGKTVRIEWIQPANPAISTTKNEKLAFAKSIFLDTYQKVHESSQPAEGIVVVFDSADGGQIEATLSSVKGLASRIIPDAAFWRQCSLDPRESFLDAAKP